MNKEGNVYIYCRQSKGNKNVSDSLSLEHQEMMCKKYCDENRLHVTGIYKEIVSARFMDLNKLKELNKLLDIIGPNDTIIIYDVSRFSRCTRKALEIVEDHIIAKGCKIFSVTEKIGYTNAQEKHIFRDLLSQAELFSDSKSEKTKEIFAYLKSLGSAIGKAPYGMRNIKEGKIIKRVNNAEENKIISFICKLYCNGNSVKEIMAHLDKNKIMKRGKKWTLSGINRILTIRGFKNIGKLSDKISKMKIRKHNIKIIDDDYDDDQKNIDRYKRMRHEPTYSTRIATRIGLAKIFDDAFEKENEDDSETQYESENDNDEDVNADDEDNACEHDDDTESNIVIPTEEKPEKKSSIKHTITKKNIVSDNEDDMNEEYYDSVTRSFFDSIREEYDNLINDGGNANKKEESDHDEDYDEKEVVESVEDDDDDEIYRPRTRSGNMPVRKFMRI
jgi:DNA invertase Pin-like site-specific DNA recombinase